MHEAPLYVNKIYACHVRGYVSLSRISSRREILENKNPKITKIAKETLHAKKTKSSRLAMFPFPQFLREQFQNPIG